MRNKKGKGGIIWVTETERERKERKIREMRYKKGNEGKFQAMDDGKKEWK